MAKAGLLHSDDLCPKFHQIRFKHLELAVLIEPRIAEVLPAFVERYRVLIIDEILPEDITEIVRSLREGQCENLPDFRNVRPEAYLRHCHLPKKSNRARSLRRDSKEHLLDKKQPSYRQDLIELSKRQRCIRKNIGLTQADYADQFNIARSAVAKIEKGVFTIRMKDLERIKEIVNRDHSAAIC